MTICKYKGFSRRFSGKYSNERGTYERKNVYLEGMLEFKFVFHLINRSLIPILRLARSLNGNNLLAHGKRKALTESAIPLILVTKVTNR